MTETTEPIDSIPLTSQAIRQLQQLVLCTVNSTRAHYQLLIKF